MSAFSPGSHEPPTDALRLAQEVSELVLTLAERLQSNFSRHAAELGLAVAHAKVLLALHPGESVSMRALAERLRYDPSNLTGVVDKLEVRGVVRRRTNDVDRRVKTLALTERGRDLRDSLSHRLTHDAGPIGHVSESELSELRDGLSNAVRAPRSGG